MYAEKNSSGDLVIPNVINGNSVELPASQNFPIVNAQSGETIHYAQSATVEVAEQACAAAWDAFKSWKKTTYIERRELLLRAVDILKQKAEEAVKRPMAETSCSDQWAGFNCQTTQLVWHDIAACLVSVVGSIPPTASSDVLSLVFKEPVGPVLLIPPWNAALILAARGVATAIAAGCTVVMKASELCPWTHQLLVEVFDEAGFPPGVLNQVQTTRTDAPKVVEAMISHPCIRKIEFIGSAPVGKIIGAMAGKYLKPVLMELGDQSPAIVLDDANLEVAAVKIAIGSTLAHGQLCFSTERIIVHEKVAEAFSKHIAEAFRTYGIPGSAVSTAGAQTVKDLFDKAVGDGAKFLVGNADLSGHASLTPSVLIDVDPKSDIMQREGFGPFATMTVISSDEEAIERANGTPSGLSASVFTNSWERGIRMAKELEFGQVQINEMTVVGGSLTPLTGVKGTGWGSQNGMYGINEFLINKHVWLGKA